MHRPMESRSAEVRVRCERTAGAAAAPACACGAPPGTVWPCTLVLDSCLYSSNVRLTASDCRDGGKRGKVWQGNALWYRRGNATRRLSFHSHLCDDVNAVVDRLGRCSRGLRLAI